VQRTRAPTAGMKPIIHQTSTADLRAENRIVKGAQVRDIETIDSELRMVAVLRHAARERGGPLPSIAVADALLDERAELTGLPGLTMCLVDH
jgi:hypothetical protein